MPTHHLVTTPRRRLRPVDLLTAGLLVLLALIGRRAEPRVDGGLASSAVPGGEPPGGAAKPARAAPMSVHLLLAGALLVAFLTVPQVHPDELGLLIAVILGGLTLWSSWGLYITSTPGPPWHRGLVQTVLAGAALGLGAYFLSELEPRDLSNRASVVAFVICTLFAVGLDIVQARRNR